MSTLPEPGTLLTALLSPRSESPSRGLPAVWSTSLPVLRAIGEGGELVDLGYEVMTGLDDRRRSRDTFTIRLRSPQGLALLRTRLLSVRWELERSGSDYLSARSGDASLVAEQIPDPGVYRVELVVPRAPHSPAQLLALGAALPGFEPLAPLLALGQLLSLGARRQASGAVIGRADLRLHPGRSSQALEIAASCGLAGNGRDHNRLRGRTPAGALTVYLLGPSAYLHLGPEPPMAGAWPDDPDEG